MRIRFRTRLALSVGFYTSLVVTAVSALVLVLAFLAIMTHYRERGELLNELVRKNVAYASRLPELVTARVSEQLVVNALLAAEIVAMAEGADGPGGEAAAAALKRVIERSRTLHGYPLVDEFWVTGEDGHSRIHTADFEFTYPADADIAPQAAAFRRLLEPDAPPMVQPMQPRTHDGAEYLYVGVGGVDKPRIVQAGIGRDRVETIQEDFTVKGIIETFAADAEVSRIAVLRPDGTVIASTDDTLVPGSVPGEFQLAALVDELDRRKGDSFTVDEFDDGVGVATRIPEFAGAGPAVLFMQYRTRPFINLVRDTIIHIAWAGLILIVVSMLISLWMARRLSRPLMQLATAVEAFGRGNLTQRIDVRGDREITALGESFNRMAHSIQTYMQTLRVEVRERERLESEFRIAAELQRQLLPESAPEMPGLDIAAMSLAAREVGGDFYDYMRMGPRRLGVAIGDATGNGLPAALLISECWSVLRAFSGDTDSAAELLFRTNNAVCQRVGETGRFATLFFAIVDTDSGLLRYAAAGHNPPLVFGADGTPRHRLHSEEGLPLGVSRDCRFADGAVRMEPGDTLVLYSDGITDARGPGGALYGEERLTAILRAQMARPVNEIVDAVINDVREHLGVSDFADDMTLVLVRHRGETMALAGARGQ